MLSYTFMSRLLIVGFLVLISFSASSCQSNNSQKNGDNIDYLKERRAMQQDERHDFGPDRW
jgi:thioredoxin-related protein